jgi:serine/threonine-protein kinase
MAPEQASGAEVDVRADLFALAAVVVEMLTGEPPRGEGTLPEVLMKVAKEDIDVSHLEVSEALRSVLAMALAHDPGDRYASPREMRDALAATPEASGAALAPA